MKNRRSVLEILVTLPSALWLAIFFLVPTVVVMAIAFKPTNPYGGAGTGWTVATWLSLGNPSYPAILWRTLWLSLLTTAASIVFAVPVGYYLARIRKRWRQFLLLLIIVPFWTSFLIRIFAWKVLLHPDGFIKQGLVFLHLAGDGVSLLYNPWAVLLVMIYSYVPFAVLPIYAAAERFDFQLIEAARDLGAKQWQSFLKVFLPGIRRGLLTAVLMVFIPALGSYLIPDLVGGPDSEMIGNKIAQRVFVDRNLPHASALSSLLTLAVLLPMTVVLFLPGRRGRPDLMAGEGK
ncbi:MAG TPA: ABC transporter permease [Syntrophales bacterium]|nr:ABC transporter permease [Syntrophales bacterium]HQB29576.1 ABC transporter permease [Syntrophales bacterium]HQN78759.1 ABC transporter permease [Syntrophales bacterium]HQQ27801.1 ABC transporter permease [Syntrophales bacterium]